MKSTWAKFRTDAAFLPKYLGVHILVLLAGCFFSLSFIHHSSSLHLNLKYLFLLPIAFVFGIQVPTLMHNCVHGNLKSKNLNFIIGELACFFVLMGMGIISINHTLHHVHSDSHLDPHNPADKSFFQFFFTSLISGVEIIQNNYYKFHGKNTVTTIRFKLCIFMHYLGIFLRLGLWFLILGPTLFVAFFIPAFISYVFSFAHVNYITHVLDEKGEAQIINVDSNYYYNFINFIGSGVYYHKNHHLNPNCFNPKYYKNPKLVKSRSKAFNFRPGVV